VGLIALLMASSNESSLLDEMVPGIATEPPVVLSNLQSQNKQFFSYNKTALEYWGKVPKELLRDAMAADSQSLSVVAALVLTISAACLTTLKPGDYHKPDGGEEISDQQAKVQLAFLVLMTISACSSLLCISISTLTFMHGTKISDLYFLDFICCIKGHVLLEAIFWYQISIATLLGGIGCAVYLLNGWSVTLALIITVAPFVLLFIYIQNIMIGPASNFYLNAQSGDRGLSLLCGSICLGQEANN
jgi:hypothetical protein